MTAEEAIEIITNAIQTEHMTAEQDRALALAQKALEKQMPKNVITQTESDREFEDFLCPHCKVILQQKYKQAKQAILYKHKFCSDCGQALDWSEENE